MKHFWNVLTVLVLVLILAVIAWGILTYLNPYHALNPFPPATPENSRMLLGWLGAPW
jgi:NhaP-type Na+/H+ or K+/H+ antiporter